jgi:hypothetical protein
MKQKLWPQPSAARFGPENSAVLVESLKSSREEIALL